MTGVLASTMRPVLLLPLLAVNFSNLSKLANAETPGNGQGESLSIRSDSACPSADAVRDSLLAMRSPEAWPRTDVAIHSEEGLLLIELGADHTRQRRLSVGLDCTARADTVALVIATWMNDLPTEGVGSPVLPALAAPSLAAPMLKSAPARYELSAGLLAAVGGGMSPGLRLEWLRMPGGSGLGWHLGTVVTAPRTIDVGGGTTHWLRVSAAAGLHARLARPRFFLAADAGLAGAYTYAWGTGYVVNQQDQSLTYGAITGLRAGLPWGRFRLWADVRVARWLYEQRVQVDPVTGGTSVTVSLPDWDTQGALGMSILFL